MTSPPTLCDTAKVLSSVLDGASERAVLVADDGTVLHLNGAASHFFYCPRPPAVTTVTDFMVCDDWRSAQHCRIVMKNGKTTRSVRNIHVVQLAPCPCCGQQYYTIYVCSKHERVRELVDHALDPVLTVDEKGLICTANDAATDLFGYTEGELVGHNISMICGGGHADHHDEYMNKYMETGVKHIIGKRREVAARKKDGSEFPCELAVQEISDASTGKRYFCGYLKDLTLIKQHEAEIEERQALAQGMINASFDSMLEIDEAGIIKVVNDSACIMFGYTREEFLGSNISIICGDGHSDRHDSYLKRYLDTGVKHIIGRKRQVKARRKDGSEIEVELGVQEVVLKGKKAFCGFMRDLTAQKKDKRALRKQQQVIHGKFFGKGGE